MKTSIQRIPRLIHRHPKNNFPGWLKILLVILGLALLVWLLIYWWVGRALSPIAPLADNWGELAGFKGSQKYLVLFQNSAELRPTGGFLSAFGDIHLTMGIPTTFDIHDSYAVPDPDEPVEAPAIIEELFSEDPNYTGWTFRDANFSPDFPTTVTSILQFLQSAGQEADYDGVVAVNLNLLEKILAITGPIEVNGIVFDENSLFDNLQFATKNFDKHDWSEFQTRKNIIGDLGKKLLRKIIFTPSIHRELAELMQTALDEKQVLAWWQDPQMQYQFAQNDWTGELRDEPNVLQLAIVEANLGGRKSDRYLKRDVENEITLDNNGHLTGALKVRLRHLGEKGYYSNQFRGNLRVFLPIGTELLGYTGDFPARPQSSTDLRQTVFDNPVFVNPGQEATFVYHYALPDDLYHENGLDMALWKQPGTENDFYRTIVRVPSGMSVRSDESVNRENIAVWETFLTDDRQAHFDVVPDTRPPLVVEQKFINSNLMELLIEFDEELQKSPAENAQNYEVWDRDEIVPDKTDTIKVIGAKYYDRGVTLLLQGVSNQPLERYGIIIHDGIYDQSGNKLHPDSAEMTVVQRLDE